MDPRHDLQSELAACVQCGLCLTACPTYQLTGMEGYSPRGRIASIRMATDDDRIVAGSSPVLQEYLDTCLGCRACEPACPSGVRYGRILEHAREQLPAARTSGVRRLGESAMLWSVARRWRLSLVSLGLYPLQKLGILALLAWLAGHRLLPRGLANVRGIPKLRLGGVFVRLSTNYTPPEGTLERGQVVLFTGCVQDAWQRDVHWATITVLTRLGYRVRMPHGQVCCGALHAHAGRLGAARKLARKNLEPLRRYKGRIVVSSAGCGAKLKEYADLLADDPAARNVARRIRDVTELLRPDDIAALRPAPPEDVRRVAMHDACHMGFVQKVTRQPRELLRAAGYDVVDLQDGGRCCGAAGTYAVHHPEWATPLRDEKIDACRSVRPDVVAVANPGCLFWMRGAPDAPPMYHPIQLVAIALVSAPASTGEHAAAST